MTQPVQSPGGTISVRTTERGLPVALRIDRAELRKSPTQLADEIMALCRLSAARAQVQRRRDLTEKGYSTSVIDPLRLATEQDLSRAEDEVLGEEDELPPTWSRSV
ncbi:hypothetical protein H7H51_23755 [Mycolicibacterium farcinogenes]|nr:hypothetical protein [Mycolicibacterium farcinogenes]